MGIQKTKIVKSVPTFLPYEVGSLRARVARFSEEKRAEVTSDQQLSTTITLLPFELETHLKKRYLALEVD